MVETMVGCSVKEFLCDQLGLSPEYVEERIQTIFLDGKPVDNTDKTMVKEGSTLALSAAMPGLLGATLRKGGYYATIRSQISYRENPCTNQPYPGRVLGRVHVKLFNLLLPELGPAFLERGIWINGNDVKEFLKGQPDAFWSECHIVTEHNQKFCPKQLSEKEWATCPIFLQIKREEVKPSLFKKSLG